MASDSKAAEDIFPQPRLEEKINSLSKAVSVLTKNVADHEKQIGSINSFLQVQHEKVLFNENIGFPITITEWIKNRERKAEEEQRIRNQIHELERLGYVVSKKQPFDGADPTSLEAGIREVVGPGTIAGA